MGLFFSGAMNAINTLIVDTHPDSPATAVAANNLFRCLVSSGATAVALPLSTVSAWAGRESASPGFGCASARCYGSSCSKGLNGDEQSSQRRRGASRRASRRYDQ